MDGFTTYGFEDGLKTLFRRCVDCPDITPTCPTCAADEWCTQIPATCAQCAYRTCVPRADTGAVNTGSTGSANSGPNIGAIVGGVIAGIVAIALITFLIWRFCIKNRRRSNADEWAEEEKHRNSDWQQRSAARSSTHTVGSLASTVMTRASNVIQIAFIPGIEGRHDGELAPPVPTIPMHAHDSNSPSSPYHDHPHTASPSSTQDHYFMPRGSTYSGFTDASSMRSSVRQSITPSLLTRNSMAPSISPSLARQSVASTIYGDGNVVPVGPVQTAYRGRANVVSVKPGSTNGPGGAPVPAMPALDLAKYGSSAPQTQTQTQTPGQTPTQTPVLQVNGAAAALQDDASVHSSSASTTTQEALRNGKHIAAQIRDATQRASKQPEHAGIGGIKRDPSPFSDEHAVTTPKLE